MKDLGNAVNGIYYLMSENRMTYSSDFAIYADLRGEDFKAISNQNQSGPLSRYTITKKDEMPDYAYNYFYRAIANVNKALSIVDNLAVSEDEKATFNDYKGQLYKYDDYRVILPIPQKEIDLAPSILVQNPQY
jgi:starch-binding outer membrane protein, SusD/RagB family